MSFNRENVTWQSSNGTWNLAFYDFYHVHGDDDEDFDPEWDVEYTEDFNCVSTGHTTQDAASDSWDGCNPGGSTVYEFNSENASACDALDAKVVTFRAAQAKAAAEFGHRGAQFRRY